ncbi:cytochrome c oxidase subunit IVB [Bacillus sp. FJAT-50079]|uniref:cytochrome c oxidase subunit IVB n=1 Tax=Bacillus sp. FJAT-50079 TaxID=2833577 RepID=UPI001BCA5DF3|nr:cytochrome c oxidase subunit IVB [Bacillus sp. FJAT-50079]MBS4207751.1 cytochrome c oxidase subunit IVB [Bacillus sp. FJAT-50079]
MENQHLNSNSSQIEYEYRRKRNAEEMRHQVISFAISIFLTLVAFGAVYAGFDKWFVIPVILLLAAVQVIFQLYYFMHMNQKGHEAPQLFIYGGVIIGFATIVCFLTIVWW